MLEWEDMFAAIRRNNVRLSLLRDKVPVSIRRRRVSMRMHWFNQYFYSRFTRKLEIILKLSSMQRIEWETCSLHLTYASCVFTWEPLEILWLSYKHYHSDTRQPSFIDKSFISSTDYLILLNPIKNCNAFEYPFIAESSATSTNNVLITPRNTGNRTLPSKWV